MAFVSSFSFHLHVCHTKKVMASVVAFPPFAVYAFQSHESLFLPVFIVEHAESAGGRIDDTALLHSTVSPSQYLFLFLVYSILFYSILSLFLELTLPFFFPPFFSSSVFLVSSLPCSSSSFFQMGSAVLPGFNGAFNGLIVLTGANTIYKNNRPKGPKQMEDMPRTTDFPSYGEFVKIATSTLVAAVRHFFKCDYR